eukprot:359793-Chlamydomonas_euryale.AAC.13
MEPSPGAAEQATAHGWSRACTGAPGGVLREIARQPRFCGVDANMGTTWRSSDMVRLLVRIVMTLSSSPLRPGRSSVGTTDRMQKRARLVCALVAIMA